MTDVENVPMNLFLIIWCIALAEQFQLNADMNSDILLRTAAIFSSIIGHWLSVCHCWFHLQVLTRAVRNASRARISKWKILAHCGIRTRDLPLTKRTRYHWAMRTDVCRVDKSSPSFTCAILINLPVARGRCSKIICHLFLSYNTCIVLLFDKLRSLLTANN